VRAACCAIAVTDVADDPAAVVSVGAVVGVGQRIALGVVELGFNRVAPRGIRGGEDRLDAQAAKDLQEARVIMDVWQVVEDDVQPRPRIAAAEAAERGDQLHDALALDEVAGEAVGVHIIEAEEVLDTMGTGVCRPHPPGPAARRPGGATHRLQLERAPFVEADDRRPGRAPAVECLDPFFFRSNAGSCDTFHVRTRWGVSPSRRSTRRTHSSVTAGISPCRTQYAVSLATDHRENGNPRSAGLDSATSIKPVMCLARRIGSRPLGFEARSNEANPLALKRRVQNVTRLTWHPTRSATTAGAWPARRSAMIRYRTNSRTGNALAQLRLELSPLGARQRAQHDRTLHSGPPKRGHPMDESVDQLGTTLVEAGPPSVACSGDQEP